MAIPVTGTAPAPPDPNAATKAETERVKAETDLEKARAERVKALGLPAFEGKTTLNPGAGAIEALILATDAIDAAARQIAEAAARVACPGRGGDNCALLILAGDEQLEFGMVAAISAEMEGFVTVFDALRPSDGRGAEALATGIAGPIAAVSAIAGLLRTETQVTAVDHASISHRVLATQVAGRLVGRAILPGAATAGLPASSRLMNDLRALARRRDEMVSAVIGLPLDKSEPIKAAVARFDTFFARVTSPDSTGRVPIVQAARLEQLLSDEPLVLRIFVEKAGGSLISRTNLWTFFGADPVKVSGGLIASFTVTDPATGRVLAADVLNCRTAIASLGAIQAGAPLHGARISSGGRDDGHAISQRPALFRTGSSGSRAMADHYLQAGEAIRRAVLRWHENYAGNWSNIVPGDPPWEMELGLWEQMLRDIRAEFGALISPCRIKTGETFANSRTHELYQLQERLSASVVCPGEEGFDG